MEAIIKVCRAMGWCWCWPKKRLEDGYDLDHFLNLRLPIFWVMGPPGCGKTTVATLLSRCSDFRLVKVSKMIKDEVMSGDKWRGKTIMSFTQGFRKGCPNEIVLNLLKEVFYNTCDDSVGYILDGFPLDLTQAKQFEFEITKVFMIIYPTLSLSSFIARYSATMSSIALEEAKERHVTASRLCQSIYRYYEQKTLKCDAEYKIELILNGLVIDLDQYFGYKFRFLSDLSDISVQSKGDD